MCHHNTFMIYGSMRNTSQEKWQKVTHISISSALVVSLIFALVGYGTFTGLVQGIYTIHEINPIQWAEDQLLSLF